MQTIGERVQELRKQRGMGRQDLADALGMTYEGVMRIEQGIVGKTLERVPKLARALGTTTDALFPEMDAPAAEMQRDGESAARGAAEDGKNDDAVVFDKESRFDPSDGYGAQEPLDDDDLTGFDFG